MAHKTVLGKGLASLLPTAAKISGTYVSDESVPPPDESAGESVHLAEAGASSSVGDPSNKDRIPGVAFAQVEEIRENVFQPRRVFDEGSLVELSESIKANGLIQPLIVRKLARGYELIAGERRLRAAKKAGLKTVPVVVRKATDRESLELAIVENVQRSDLNCIEEAMAYAQLIEEFSLTQDEVAQRVGKSRAAIANHLRLLNLPEGIILNLKNQTLTLGHAKVLLSLQSREAQLRAQEAILAKRLSVREAEDLVERLKKERGSDAVVSAQERDDAVGVRQRMEQLALDLTKSVGIKVVFRGGAEKGRVVLSYGSREDLDRIINRLQTSS